MHPAALLARGGEDLAQRAPEFQGAVADGEHRGAHAAAGAVTQQVGPGLGRLAVAIEPDAQFGRILAAYGGIFVAGSLAWGVLLDGYRPDRFDLIGAVICLLGVAVIIYAPR